MLAEGLLGLQIYAGVNTSTRPRHDPDGQSPASHCADTGWIPGHVRLVVGKVVLGQISVVNLVLPPPRVIIPPMLHNHSFIHHRRCVG